jgi:hypothetical protein
MENSTTFAHKMMLKIYPKYFYGLKLYIFLELETLWQLNLSKYWLEDSRVASWSKHKIYIEWFELSTSVECAGVAQLLECSIKSIAYSALTFEEILEFSALTC